MGNQPCDGSALGERLPLAEIWRRYPDEWVVLVDADWTNMRTTVGVVHAHSTRRKDAYAKARGLRSCAILWTGKIQGPIPLLLGDVRRRV